MNTETTINTTNQQNPLPQAAPAPTDFQSIVGTGHAPSSGGREAAAPTDTYDSTAELESPKATPRVEPRDEIPRNHGALSEAQLREENQKRQAALAGPPYDPLRGIGCFGQRVKIRRPQSGELNYVPASLAHRHFDTDLQLALARFTCDFEYWCAACVRIRDKATGRIIPFHLNPPQRHMLAVMEQQRLAGKPIRVILLKARQWGGSTLVLIYMAWFQLILHPGANSLICGHKRTTSSVIKGIYNTMFRNYPSLYLRDQKPITFRNYEHTSSVQSIHSTLLQPGENHPDFHPLVGTGHAPSSGSHEAPIPTATYNYPLVGTGHAPSSGGHEASIPTATYNYPLVGTGHAPSSGGHEAPIPTATNNYPLVGTGHAPSSGSSTAAEQTDRRPQRSDNQAKPIISAESTINSAPEGAIIGSSDQRPDSLVIQGSAYSQDLVRGFDISLAHLSEVAFWPDTTIYNPADVMRSVDGTVLCAPGTIEILESTANGMGGYFHTEWLRAQARQSDKAPVFIPWHKIPLYQLPVASPMKFFQSLNPYERYLWDSEGCSLQQICWYRNKSLAYPSPAQMMAEFPTTPLEAFAGTSRCVFDLKSLDALKSDCRPPIFSGDIIGQPKSLDARLVPNATALLRIWAHPDGSHYATNIHPLVGTGHAPSSGGRNAPSPFRGSKEGAMPTGAIRNRYVAAVDVGGRSPSSDYSVITVIDLHVASQLHRTPKFQISDLLPGCKRHHHDDDELKPKVYGPLDPTPAPPRPHIYFKHRI